MDLEVIDADGRPVHRGEITLTYDASGQLTVVGLLGGDCLFINGVIEHGLPSPEEEAAHEAAYRTSKRFCICDHAARWHDFEQGSSACTLDGCACEIFRDERSYRPRHY